MRRPRSHESPRRGFPWPRAWLPLTLALLASAAPQLAAAAGEFDPQAYAGRVVLLDSWASWCGPCAESFPWMEEMQRRHADEGLVVVAVNLDEDPAAAQRFLAEHPNAFRHLRDAEGTIAKQYGVRVMPSAVLLDRNGLPAFVHSGFHPERRAEYEEHLIALLEGRVSGNAAPPDADTPRVGVQPWERGILARDEMRLDCDPLDLAIDDHIYFSKEASSGGRGFGGGGCGCN